MKEITPYLNFDGTCKEAMTFYGRCLGAELFTMPFAEAPGCDVPADAKDRLAHARLTKGSEVPLLMASDCPPGMPFHAGNNFSVSVECESREEVDKLFASLGENGKPVMPAQDMFWGAYWGMVTDQYGIGWMFNYTLPK